MQAGRASHRKESGEISGQYQEAASNRWLAAESLYAFAGGDDALPTDREMVGALLVADLIAGMKGP